MDELQSSIEGRVNAALAEDERTRDLRVEAIDKNGVVTLLGNVPTEEHRRAAEIIAGGQPGVVKVINSLQLRRTDVLGRREDEDEPKLDQEDNPPAFQTRTG
jgi:hypothetical protein